MAGKLEGKVAFITGAARGQGRSHAIRLAQEGADIIAVDICAQIASVAYPMATPEDLAETVKAVEALDRRIVARQADVRDEDGLRAAFEAGAAELGPVDIVLANAGIAPMSLGEELHQAWQDVIDVNLTGVFNTVEIAIPSMIERGAGGAIVLTSSTAGITGIGGPSRGGLGYTASKHGVVGLMRSYANSLAPHRIRVNSVAPHRGEHPDGGQRHHAGLAGRRPQRGRRDGQRAPGRHDRAGGRLQRDRLAGLRRRPLHHRRHAAGRRGLHGQEVEMAGRVAGKVAFITGAARGQGRAHAIRLAEEGADIIAVDICRDYDTVPYPMATEADLAETVRAVEALDRRIVATQADVRDPAALKSAVDEGVAQLGRLGHRLCQRRHRHRAVLGRGDDRPSGRTPWTPT